MSSVCPKCRTRSAVPQYPEIAYRAHFSPIRRKRRPHLPCVGLSRDSRGPAIWSTWKFLGSEACNDVGEEGAILLLWRPGGWLRRLRRGRRALCQVAMDLARVKRPTWLDLLAVFRDHLSAAPFTVRTARHRVSGRVQHKPSCCEVAQIIAAYFRGENHQRLFLAHGSMVPTTCRNYATVTASGSRTNQGGGDGELPRWCSKLLATISPIRTGTAFPIKRPRTLNLARSPASRN